MVDIKIRLAREEDIERVSEIYEAYLDYEEENGTTTNWIRGVYPTKKNAIRGVENESLFVGELDGKIIGSYVLNKVQPQEYEKIPWKWEAREEEVIVIHTLCLDVSLQKKGLGKAFVDFALEYGRKLGCKVMRLDTWEENFPAANLYKKLNFRYAGKTEFLFEGAIRETLITFEYLL